MSTFSEYAKSILDGLGVEFIGSRTSHLQNAQTLVFAKEEMGVFEVAFSDLEIMQNHTPSSQLSLIASRVGEAITGAQ